MQTYDIYVKAIFLDVFLIEQTGYNAANACKYQVNNYIKRKSSKKKFFKISKR